MKQQPKPKGRAALKIEDLIPAVGYGRMSTEDQELSPQQQRREVEEYAKRNGYKILRWYFDEGISASKGDELRMEYQQMLVDSNAKDFRAVLCWATSRFTRNHPHEAATGKCILKNNGIWLDTVKEGKIDWNSFEGMIKDSIYTIIDHTYSVGLGKDSLRGRRNTFLAGGYPYGNIPFGYNHLYVSGTERREVRRGTKTKNLRGWMQFLAIVPEEAEIVRRIFRLYVDEDKSLCAIARLLNHEIIPGPGKGVNAVWTVQNVRTRLRCSAYARISRIGGKPEHYRKAHNRLDLEERQGEWEGIIDRETWDEAQAKLDGNKGHPQEGKSGPLQGILRCGCCGHVLHKENPRKADDPRGNKYRCNSTGKGLLTKCKRWTCYESEIMPRILAELVKAVDEETVWLLKAMQEQPGRITNREVLQTHLRSLEESISEAAGAFIDPKVSQVMKKALEKKVEDLEAEVVETRRRLDAMSVAEREGGIQSFLDWWEKIRPQLVWIGTDGSSTTEGMDGFVLTYSEDGNIATSLHKFAMPSAGTGEFGKGKLLSALPGIQSDPGKLRALLKRLNVQIRVYWRPVTEEERAAQRKGRGHGCPGRKAETVIDKARLKIEIKCGSPDGRNAWAGCHDSWRRADRHRPSSRARAGSP
jgi:DNA invertase Pin-like site-specific DNA recombinase